MTDSHIAAPTTHQQRLLGRLDAIGRSLAETGQALALLGLGSVGAETERIDAYSDLDFFAIVQSGYKQGFLLSLDWLALPDQPIVYSFQNTPDGYKALYQDGIFCEFAVFEADEMRRIPFARGRIVWQEPSFDPALTTPRIQPKPEHLVEWLLGEALTNLYVGLGRMRRGEVLSATRFIQGYAVDRVLDLTSHVEPALTGHADQFDTVRRFEQRYPATAALLPIFAQGYARNIESARAILAFLDKHFEVNAAMKQAILGLCDPA